MAFKLTVREQKRKGELVTGLRQARSQLEDSISEFNKAVADAKELLKVAEDKYNETLQEARGFCEDMTNDWDNQIAERSDSWRESEQAEAAQKLVNEWNGVSLDDVDLDMPDEIEVPSEDHSEVLEQLSDEADHG
jgi:ClpP class serine protease